MSPQIPQGAQSPDQQMQTRLNDLDAAFAAATSTLASVQTQLNGIKTGLTATPSSPPTWSQVESVFQSVSGALSQIHLARQALPIAVS